jgi:hypothetical protein
MVGSEAFAGALGIGRKFDLRYIPMSDMCKTFSPTAYARLLACAREEPLVLEHVLEQYMELCGTKSSFLISTMQHGVKITTVQLCFRPVTNTSLTITTFLGSGYSRRLREFVAVVASLLSAVGL